MNLYKAIGEKASYKDQLAKVMKAAKDKNLDVTKNQLKASLKKNIEHLKKGELWSNEKFMIQVYKGSDADEMIHIDQLKGKCTWLSIRTQDRNTNISWAELQDIKNTLCGKECDALQMYPKESRLVDSSNQYHLIVLPEDIPLPFGWITA
jgi:hypothetical protein